MDFRPADSRDTVVDAFVEGDHVAGIHDVALAVLKFLGVDCAVAGEEEVAGALDPDEEEAFLGEEGLGAAPLGVDVEGLGGGHVRAGLDEEGLVAHVGVEDVSWECGSEGDLAGVVGVEGVEEEAFVGEELAGETSEEGRRPGWKSLG